MSPISAEVELQKASSLKKGPITGSLIQLNLDKDCTTEEVLTYFENGWQLYECLFTCLNGDEVFYMIPNSLRRPLIFYLGHTAVFYINKFVAAEVLTEQERLNPHFENIFAVGVDEMSWDDMIDQNFDWPPVSEVWEYRKRAHDVVVEIIKRTEFKAPIRFDDTKVWSVFMGMEHERIHLETSSVLIRELPLCHVRRPLNNQFTAALFPTENAPSNGRAPPNKMVSVPGGKVIVGKPRSYPAYGWDCEYGELSVEVEDFQASQFKVTNGEWLGFVNAKAYEVREYWDEEGWNWVQYTKARHPHFWVALDASKYRFRTLFDIIDMPWDWPVEVNYLEAAAYCRWKGQGYRVITEPEWRRITGIEWYDPESPKAHSLVEKDPAFQPRDSYPGNLNATRWASSTPVNYYPPNELGFYDAFGNVWEWASTSIDGLPGFRTQPIYQDFSTPCFDERHNMILGGSWVSTGNETSYYARYAFRRHFFQFSGFRLVRSEVRAKEEKTQIYETTKLRQEYLFFHFGKSQDLLPYDFGPSNGLEYPQRCAELAIDFFQRFGSSNSDGKPIRGLDIGCAVGRSTFELAKLCHSVVGVDYSHSFIDAANALIEHGELESLQPLEGELSRPYVVRVSPEIDRSRVKFLQGDAHCLSLGELDPATAEPFDIILGANLIDRLQRPRVFLDLLPTLVKPGGVVVLTSPYTWLTDFTPKSEWLGGYLDEKGEPVRTFDTLKRLLSAVGFELLEDRNMPFLIYEHQRKFQWSVAHATVWKRTISQ